MRARASRACARLHACVCVCFVYESVPAHVHGHASVRLACVHVCEGVSVHAGYMCMRVQAFVSMCVHAWPQLHVCSCVCMVSYICVYARMRVGRCAHA